MNKKDTKKIIKIMQECCAVADDISPATEFKTISIDSLSFVRLIVNLESEFNIEFEPEKLNIYDYKIVNDIIKAAENLINGNSTNTDNPVCGKIRRKQAKQSNEKT